MRHCRFTPTFPGRRLGTLVLAVLTAMALGASDGTAQSRQETLIIARTMSDYITNDPSRTFEFTSQIIDKAAYDTLVTVEAPDFAKILPNLATEWKISPDGLSYTFTLRKGSIPARTDVDTSQFDVYMKDAARDFGAAEALVGSAPHGSGTVEAFASQLNTAINTFVANPADAAAAAADIQAQANDLLK